MQTETEYYKSDPEKFSFCGSSPARTHARLRRSEGDDDSNRRRLISGELTRSEIIQPGIQSKMALVMPTRLGLQGFLSSAVLRADKILNCSSSGTSKTS